MSCSRFKQKNSDLHITSRLRAPGCITGLPSLPTRSCLFARFRKGDALPTIYGIYHKFQIYASDRCMAWLIRNTRNKGANGSLNDRKMSSGLKRLASRIFGRMNPRQALLGKKLLRRSEPRSVVVGKRADMKLNLR